MKKRKIPGVSKGAGFGAKAESSKMLGKTRSLSHDNPPGFGMDAGKAAGKTASGKMRGKEKAAPNVAKKPRKVAKASKPEKAPKIKIKKPG